MEITPALGIGDLLIWKMYALYENKDIFKLNINLKIITTYRTHPKEYIEFINYLIKQLFNNCSVSLIQDSNSVDYPKFSNKIKNTQLFHAFKFNKIQLYPYSNYIIFHTKLRLTPRGMDDFIKNYEKFYKYILNYKTQKTILIVGEREVDNNLETQIHNIKSVYQLLLELKNNNLVYDLTKPTIHNANTIDEFEKDCHLIHGAEYNITMGIGGNFVLSTAMAKHTISYNPYAESYYVDNMESPCVSLSYNIEDFCKDIDKFTLN